jgi:hypothetical protein
MAQSIPGVDADTSRIEQILLKLERLQKDADGIVNTYVDYIAARTGNSFTATKAAIIFPLGSQINFPCEKLRPVGASIMARQRAMLISRYCLASHT